MKLQLYDKSKIDFNNLMFTGVDLRKMLIPVILEQLLNSLMGMVDTMMVSNVGEAAISAVSLVDALNVLIIQVFSALATGGTIICSQYLGSNDKKMANKSAKQVTLVITVISSVLMFICIFFRKSLLVLIFGRVEPDVMAASVTYLWMTALSFPALALFSAGSAFYRACGNTKFPMKISVISNVLNIVGNYMLIFIFNMGVAGAALATLLSRVFCMVVIFYYLRLPKQEIIIDKYASIRPDFSLIRKILRVGVPSGIENGMFQFGKLAIQSSVSTLGTTAIAAQAMTIIMEGLSGMGGIGVGIAMMTVVGQCIGAGKKEEAKYYIVKLTVIGEVIVAISCFVVYAMCKPVAILGGMTPDGTKLFMEMMLAITIYKPTVWALSFVPSYGLRAAGDVRFSMILSSVTMWACRVALATYLIRYAGVGPMAVWIGMFADWTLRAIAFTGRFFSGKWLNKQVI